MSRFSDEITRMIEATLATLRLPAGRIDGQLSGGQVAPAGPGSPGVVDLDDVATLPIAVTDIDATGTPSSSTYLRGDGAWAAPAGGGGNVSTGAGAITVPAWEFHPDALPASPNAADDEFGGASLGGAWAWVNQGSATATVARSRVVLTVPSTTSGNVRGIFRAYPGASTWQAQATGWSSQAEYAAARNYAFGIARRDSSTGRIETWCVLWDSGTAALSMALQRWTSPTTFSATVVTRNLGRVMFGSFYLQLADNGTNVSAQWSVDGITYIEAASFARAEFLASADQIGLAVFAQQNGGDIYLQSDWMRRTA